MSFCGSSHPCHVSIFLHVKLSNSLDHLSNVFAALTPAGNGSTLAVPVISPHFTTSLSTSRWLLLGLAQAYGWANKRWSSVYILIVCAGVADLHSTCKPNKRLPYCCCLKLTVDFVLFGKGKERGGAYLPQSRIIGIRSSGMR